MTLEQIKNRQHRINESLYALLQNTQEVIISIAGEQPVSESLAEIKPYSGFLEEISVAQDQTEKFIGEIECFNRLLIVNTYAQNEDKCVAR